MYLNIGDKAPNFTLPNYNNEIISLNDFIGITVLLWFFPKANTPGWIIEGKGFRDEFKNFNKRNIQIIGISADPPEKQNKFVKKFNFQYMMLCDESKNILKTYKVWAIKKFMGREYEGIHRISYLINKEGIIDKVYDKVKTKTHAQDVLRELI